MEEPLAMVEGYIIWGKERLHVFLVGHQREDLETILLEPWHQDGRNFPSLQVNPIGDYGKDTGPKEGLKRSHGRLTKLLIVPEHQETVSPHFPGGQVDGQTYVDGFPMDHDPQSGKTPH
jgi:hypothetical protein